MNRVFVYFSLGVLAALLSACGGTSSAVTPVSQGAARRATSNYTILHNFGGSSDGTFVTAGLVYVNHKLYGTTDWGGTAGLGTVFVLKTTGRGYNVLYSFPGGSHQGATPTAPLINVNGTLYGTTFYGGSGSCFAQGNSGCGTVFKITASGSESVVYNFTNGTYGSNVDGIYPLAPLVYVNGNLYGTTQAGGPNSCVTFGWTACGTVFGIGASYYSQLLAFDGTNGAGPDATLAFVNGSFYGTTACGGSYGSGNNCPGGPPGGTLYRIGFAGKEKILHNFGFGTDGDHPTAPVIDVNGTLYGTTYDGGAYGKGTVFSVSPSGTGYTTLYSFGSASNDGTNPNYGPLLNVNGTLYGMTGNGGAYNHGTIFSITTAGAETVLYSFGSGSGDGTGPEGGLVYVSGTLYGTTSEGGTHNGGTAFSYAL